jgi:hypothetical protein
MEFQRERERERDSLSAKLALKAFYVDGKRPML